MMTFQGQELCLLSLPKTSVYLQLYLYPAKTVVHGNKREYKFDSEAQKLSVIMEVIERSLLCWHLDF